jgi:hypothetical protein
MTESSPFDGAALRPFMTGVFPLLSYEDMLNADTGDTLPLDHDF